MHAYNYMYTYIYLFTAIYMSYQKGKLFKDIKFYLEHTCQNVIRAPL